MHLIAQGTVEPAAIVQAVKPLAIYHHGESTDNAYRAGRMESVKDYCKKTRQAGVLVGVGSHIPEVLAKVEDEGWDVDFYAGCVYNRRRTPEELRRLLGGELPEMPGEVYLQDDPPRMYRFMRQTGKPCFAFKILAAGRVASAEQAFRTAFQGIKPGDAVFAGMFPRSKTRPGKTPGGPRATAASFPDAPRPRRWRLRTPREACRPGKGLAAPRPGREPLAVPARVAARNFPPADGPAP
jgi:hypothetical protein